MRSTSMSLPRLIGGRSLLLSLAFLTLAGTGFAQSPRIKKLQRSTPADPCVPCTAAASPTLGTFEPTPTIMVRSNWPAGGGFSPLGIYGDQTMSLYGPTSPLRSTAAPVMTYTRGYDGVIQARPGTGFSTPNLPGLSPVVYPRPGNYYYGPRMDRTDPAWTTGYNWIDQN